MNFQDLIQSMTPAIYENLQQAVAIGRWANGMPLSDEQRESAIQAILAYQAKHQLDDEDEPFKVQADGSVRIGKSQRLNSGKVQNAEPVSQPGQAKATHNDNQNDQLIFKSKGN